MEHEKRLAGYKYRSDIIEGISQVSNKWLVPDSPENGARPLGEQFTGDAVKILDRVDGSNEAFFTLFSINSLNPPNDDGCIASLYCSTIFGLCVK